jgi:hypothetical protein
MVSRARPGVLNRHPEDAEARHRSTAAEHHKCGGSKHIEAVKLRDWGVNSGDGTRGYSSSQDRSKARLAARTAGSMFGTPINREGLSE